MNSLRNYRGYRFPPEIISHTVWLYHRFTLSLRDIEDLLAERNVIVSYELIRQWCARFGLDYANIGNAHLRWAFGEAACLFLRNNPLAQKYHQLSSTKIEIHVL
jgi:transposase-like protein